MGSDSHPIPDVEGTIRAARELAVRIILVGDQQRIDPILHSHGAANLAIEVLHAPEILSMDDKGEDLVLKARHKDARNSMAVGVDLVKHSKADAFITAGNSGAAMVTALFRLGRIRGIDLPAIAPIFPTAKGTCVVLDSGANPDCSPENLVQFAIMGSVYAQKGRGVPSPRVGLVSNGEEDGKGNRLVKAAGSMLRASGLNYHGNIEGKEVFGGDIDVVVADGFTGNVMLKTAEAVGKLIVDTIRTSIRTGGILTQLGGLLVKPALKKLAGMLNPNQQGAAVLLGVNGLVLIGHGRSDSTAIFSAIGVAKRLAEAQLIPAIKDAIQSEIARQSATGA